MKRSRVRGVWLLILGLMMPVGSAAAGDWRQTPWQPFTSELFADHRLAGVIWDPVAAKELTPDVRSIAVFAMGIQAIALVTIFIASAWSPTLISLGRTRQLAAVAAGTILYFVWPAKRVPPRAALFIGPGMAYGGFGLPW